MDTLTKTKDNNTVASKNMMKYHIICFQCFYQKDYVMDIVAELLLYKAQIKHRHKNKK